MKKKEKSRQYLTDVGLLDPYFEERMEEMAIDMAERENERHYDQMQFERAGEYRLHFAAFRGTLASLRSTT